MSFNNLTISWMWNVIPSSCWRFTQISGTRKFEMVREIFFFETKTEVKWKQRCNKLTCTLYKLNIEKKNSGRYTFHSSLFTGCYMMVLYQTKYRHWWRFPVLSGGIYRTPDCEPCWVLLWEWHTPYPLKSIFVSFENFRAFPNSPYSSSCSQKSFRCLPMYVADFCLIFIYWGTCFRPEDAWNVYASDVMQPSVCSVTYTVTNITEI